MSIYFALLVPFIVTGVFYYFKRHEFVWWEFFIPILSVLLVIVISKVLIDYTSVQFNEYWGSTVKSVYEREPYNYWHSETCSRSVACGTDSKGNTKYCTEWYDCSHQDDVGPSWWGVSSINENFIIDEKTYEQLVNQFNTGKLVVKKRKNYDSSDKCIHSRGSKFEGKPVGETSYVYETKWNDDENTRKAYTSQHSYENRIKASDLTVFNISLITDKQADTLGLFKYPQYVKGLEYPTILGGNVSKDIQEKFKRLNGKFGMSNQLRLWVLVFDDKPSNIAQYQENYWVKGNKNELVICIGKKGEQVLWSHAFSWSLSPTLTAEVKSKVLDLYNYRDTVIKKQLPPAIVLTKPIKKSFGKVGEKLPNVLPLPKLVGDSIKIKSAYPMLTETTWNDYYNYLDKNLGKFQRRSFVEFDYITVEPSTLAIIIVYLIALIVSVGTNMIVINNEVYNENND